MSLFAIISELVHSAASNVYAALMKTNDITVPAFNSLHSIQYIMKAFEQNCAARQDEVVSCIYRRRVFI